MARKAVGIHRVDSRRTGREKRRSESSLPVTSRHSAPHQPVVVTDRGFLRDGLAVALSLVPPGAVGLVVEGSVDGKLTAHDLPLTIKRFVLGGRDRRVRQRLDV